MIVGVCNSLRDPFISGILFSEVFTATTSRGLALPVQILEIRQMKSVSKSKNQITMMNQTCQVYCNKTGKMGIISYLTLSNVNTCVFLEEDLNKNLHDSGRVLKFIFIIVRMFEYSFV